MPKCKINGHEIEVKEGTTIMEAFYQLKEEIAHYCYHPGLSIAGVCRLCMVQIKGNPRMQIACNTTVQEGMEITNQSKEVQETVRWGLDFHLINHPLDCPICDQAGECELQIQYMKFGKYDPEMSERKVKKRKVVDLGSKVVLDSERCILCSRCVRFTDEVTKTHELGIFNRGDQSEIGTFKDKPLENNYSLNTVDICPVGALTSKDFRFRQRVWYLKDKKTVCAGCSTGCKVNAYFNEEGLFRLRPSVDKDVNGYWMCDEGRKTYKNTNRPYRLHKVRKGQKGHFELLPSLEGLRDASRVFMDFLNAEGPDSVAAVLTGQYTNEEYKAFFELFKDKWKLSQIYHWKNNPESFEDFDGLLFRGDRNPNTKGLLQHFQKYDIQTKWVDLKKNLSDKKIKFLLVVGPENQDLFPDKEEKAQLFAQAENIIWFLSNPLTISTDGLLWQVPLKTYFEKNGTFLNFEGRQRKVERVLTMVEKAFTLEEVCSVFESGNLNSSCRVKATKGLKTNEFVNKRGIL